MRQTQLSPILDKSFDDEDDDDMCDTAASEATKDIVRTVHVTRGDTPTQLEDAQARHLPFFPDHSCV